MFTNTITKRKHDTAHSHPELVGTLDKAKFVINKDAEDKGVLDDSNVKVLERDFFAEHIAKGIISPTQRFSMVLELKYDGVSVEADCINTVESARTRGDTGIGVAADITPILEGYPFTKAKDLIGEKQLGVKFEAIMTHYDLYRFNLAKNYNYKNCRTAIVGLFGSGDANLYRDYITLIPLALDRSDIPEVKWDRRLEIEFLNKYYSTKNQPLRYTIIEGDYKQCLHLIRLYLKEAEVARNYLDFMYDGIVVSYLDEDIREKLGRKNFVNKYSMAVKFNPLKKQTTFLGYTFTIGQDGSVTPMIHYNPVEFYGTIHDKSTGHSYERFKTLNLRPGDILDVEYVNDVMPYVSKAECLQNDTNQNEPVSFIDTCISCGSELVISESGKTVFCKNINCPSRVTSRLNNMLDKLNLKDFAEQSIISIGKTHLCDMIDLKQEDLENILGIVNAQKFVDRMTQLKTEPIFDFQIVGALGFTNIASQKWKLIFSNITLKELYSSWLENPMNMHILADIKGIGTSVVSTILEEMIYFQRDIEYILSMPNVVNSRGQSFGKSIRCTGFRCPELMEELRALGHDANDNGSVTKTTDILLVPIKGHFSSKIAKAGPDTQIVPIDEFISNRSKYLQ